MSPGSGGDSSLITRRASRSKAARPAVTGIVRTHVSRISVATPQRTFDSRSAAPAPTIAELITWLRLTGPPRRQCAGRNDGCDQVAAIVEAVEEVEDERQRDRGEQERRARVHVKGARRRSRQVRRGWLPPLPARVTVSTSGCQSLPPLDPCLASQPASPDCSMVTGVQVSKHG